MDKISINKISNKVYKQKGFPSGSFNACFTCKCGKNGEGGACCKNGVYVDKESYELIIKHKKSLEQKIGLKIEKCFDDEWSDITEFLGKKGIGTSVIDDTCSFRSHAGQGCEIVRLVLENNLPRRMIPSGCRLYPLTWKKGKMFLEKIEKNCVCIDKHNKTKKSIYETQKEEIDDIFCFE